MPKIIFKCRYLKDGARSAHLVEYMAAGEGVEKLRRGSGIVPQPRDTHGLFSDIDKPVILSEVFAHHRGMRGRRSSACGGRTRLRKQRNRYFSSGGSTMNCFGD